MPIDQTVPWTALDAPTQAYLKQIRRDRSAGHPGVYFVEQRFPWAAFLSLSAIPFLVAGAASMVPPSDHPGRWPGAITGLALFLLFLGLLPFWRQWIRGAARPFRYTEGSWFWEVGLLEVRIVDLRQVQLETLQNCFRNGLLHSSNLLVRPPGGPDATLRFDHPDEAMSVQRLLAACRQLRAAAATGPLPPEVKADLLTPVGLARRARQILQHPGQATTPASHSGDRAAQPSPPATGGSPWRFRRKLAVPAMVLVLSSHFLLPRLQNHLDEAHRYAKVMASRDTDPGPAEDYLDRHPESARAEEVARILDERRFNAAQVLAVNRRSPAGLRRYLATSTLRLYEREARLTLRTLYDEEIARLASLQRTAGTDPALIAGLRSLIAATADRPEQTVTLSFKHRVALPTGSEPGQEDKDWLWMLSAAERDPAVARLIERTNRPIIPPDAAFAPTEMRRRELRLLSQIRDTINAVVRKDMLTFQIAPQGELADIEIEYQLRSSGEYVRYSASDARVGLAKDELLGLLRGYDIHWRVEIGPPSSARRETVLLVSTLYDNVTYLSSPEDPRWAIYAVVTHAGFLDFTHRFITKAGLEARQPPRQIRYRDTVEAR